MKSIIASLIALIALMAIPLHGQIVSGSIKSGSIVNAKQRVPNTFVDTFDRATANPMTTNASDGIGIWTSGDGGALIADCRININILFGTSGVENGCRVYSPDFRPDQSASFIVGNPTTIGIMVRVQSPSNWSGYLVSIDDSTHVSFSRVDDTGALAYVPLGVTRTVTAINAQDEFKVNMVGNVIEAFVNGVSIGSETDGVYTSGNPACYFYGLGGSIVSFAATEL